jgi:hypothetical protein
MRDQWAALPARINERTLRVFGDSQPVKESQLRLSLPRPALAKRVVWVAGFEVNIAKRPGVRLIHIGQDVTTRPETGVVRFGHRGIHFNAVHKPAPKQDRRCEIILRVAAAGLNGMTGCLGSCVASVNVGDEHLKRHAVPSPRQLKVCRRSGIGRAPGDEQKNSEDEAKAHAAKLWSIKRKN